MKVASEGDYIYEHDADSDLLTVALKRGGIKRRRSIKSGACQMLDQAEASGDDEDDEEMDLQ